MKQPLTDSKMRIVQTFWTAGQDPLKCDFGWRHAEYNLMSWALSCICLRMHYDEVALYTDEEGKHVLIDLLNLPYTEVHVVYDRTLGLSQHWAQAKMRTYAEQTVPFIHVDGDVYLSRRIPDAISHSPLVAQNREIMKELNLNDIPEMSCGINDADSVEVYNNLSETGSESPSGSSAPWGSGRGNCFFTCMENIGSHYGLKFTEEEYGCKYNSREFWEKSGYVRVTTANGPTAYFMNGEDRIPNPDTANFINMFFETSGGWETNSSKIDDYFKRKAPKGQVIGVTKTDIEDVDHAVILDGDSGNYYSYKDPLNGERGDIPKSQVEYAIKIYGTKTSEEK